MSYERWGMWDKMPERTVEDLKNKWYTVVTHHPSKWLMYKLFHADFFLRINRTVYLPFFLYNAQINNMSVRENNTFLHRPAERYVEGIVTAFYYTIKPIFWLLVSTIIFLFAIFDRKLVERKLLLAVSSSALLQISSLSFFLWDTPGPRFIYWNEMTLIFALLWFWGNGGCIWQILKHPIKLAK